MSALGGILRRDERPVSEAGLHRISQTMDQIGPDGEQIRISKPVGMVFRPFRTFEDRGWSRQPLLDKDGLVLCWNGRLDDRKGLKRSLGLEETWEREASEPELVLAAYRKWGADFLAHLIGDFAVALWDPATRHLLLGTDAFAVRPLFYHVTPRRVVWASRARTVLDAAGLSAQNLDEEFIASFFTRPVPTHHSPFEKVSTIPPGHLLVVSEDRDELHRYWTPDPEKAIRYKTDEEYEEHFREVFHKAVGSRLRGDAPMFSDLSGGLDSSSIVCVGDELLAKGAVEAPALHTVSYVYDACENSDEREFSRTVEEQRGRQGLHIRDDDHPLLSPVPESFEPDLPTCQSIYLARHQHLYEHMSSRGARVLLRGFAGDQVFWGEVGKAPHELADHLVRGSLLQCALQGLRWSRALQTPWHKVMWRGALWPMLPRTWKARTQFTFPLEGWFTDGFIERGNLKQKVLGPEDDVGFPLPSQRRQYSMIRQVTQDTKSELHLDEGCVEIRYPFLDRRLVEFALAIPMEQKLRPGETRSVLRRALRGTLPEAVRRRRSKAGPEEAIYRALVRESSWLSDLLSEPRVSAYDFVDRAALRTSIEKAKHGVPLVSPQLLRTISLELWLRSLGESTSSVDDSHDEFAAVHAA